ncbi:MAG: hypothetical protein MUE95_11875 [Cyclobacteriaceae bacterium]|nr:hypothetical protein [Cyclobacteriaceae bacterium]
MKTFRIIQLIFLLAAATGCKIDREKTIDRNRFTFRITADSHLFFKNVRQIYYDFTDLSQAHTHVYRLSNRYTGQDYPAIHPVIVIDWKKEEAYLLVEGNDIVNEENTWMITEVVPRTSARYAYQLSERGRENMLEFATKIYEGIMAENEFFIILQGKELPFLQNPDDRENFRVVMGDYYRLTRIIR